MIASATSPRSGNYRDQTAYMTCGYVTGDTAYPYSTHALTAFRRDLWSDISEPTERIDGARATMREAFYLARVSAYPDAIERASWLAARPVRRAPPLLVAPRSRSRVGIRASGRRMTWRTKRRKALA